MHYTVYNAMHPGRAARQSSLIGASKGRYVRALRLVIHELANC